MKRVGILTGGGDVPGLNAAIQQLVWRMEGEGYEVLGLRRGWAAADLILAGKTGRLVAVQNGRYTTEPLEIVGEGTKRVDVERFYDSDLYRPNIVGEMGLPMFLC